MAEIIKGNNNLASILQFEVEKLDYSKLKAKEDRKGLVKSGETMYLDLQRMHTTLIINGKKMVEDTDDEQEESLIGKSMTEMDDSISLLFELDYGKENYRPYLIGVFKKIFQYAEAEVPNDVIIQELITNCNQAGYDGCLYMGLTPILSDSGLMIKNHTRIIHIDCNNSNCAELKINEKMDIAKMGSVDPKEQALISFSSSLEFKLETQENKERIKYTDGKLSLTILPNENDINNNISTTILQGLEEQMVRKNLLDIIIELIEKAFGIKIGKEYVNVTVHDLGNPKSSITESKIEEVHGEGIVVA